ncbi:transcriptional regulator, AraC family [gamma proteobacterium HTCC5015]|nr:transcriptional regulator, AraC family [gamma proteobacterium HTCC5015]
MPRFFQHAPDHRTMLANNHWCGLNDRWISSQYLPALLVDIAERRGVHRDLVLSGTGLFEDHFLREGHCISTAQLERLVLNVQRRIGHGEAGFLLGNALADEPSSCLASLVPYSPSIHDLLCCLRNVSGIYSPMMWVNAHVDHERIYLVWRPRVSACAQTRQFWMDALSTLITASSKSIVAAPLPWQFEFSAPMTKHSEQYRVHLGDNTRFGCQVDAMSLPRQYLHVAHRAHTTAFHVAQHTIYRQHEKLSVPLGFYQTMHRYLQCRIHAPPPLAEAGKDFCMSPATFKRHLYSHGIRYQTLVDQVRREMSIYLYRIKGWNHDQVATYLNYSDMSNFRRSFKRWTGHSPVEFIAAIKSMA